MNKLLKKTLATLSCTVLIGQVMLTSIAGATEELLTKDLDLDVTKDLTSPVLNLELNKNKTENTTTKSIDLVIGDGATNNTDENNSNQTTNQTSSDNNTDQEASGTTPNNNQGQNSDGSSTEKRQCNTETKSTFMNSLSDIINEMLKDNEKSSFKSTKLSEDGNSLILYTDEEKAEIPNLINYINSLNDYILGKKDGENSKEHKFWTKLASNNNGLDLTVTTISNLVSFNLGESEKITVNFDDCLFSFGLEIETDNSGSNGGTGDNNGGDNGGNNNNNQCSNETKSTFINSLSDAVNTLIKNSNNTDFKSAKASVGNDTLILYVKDKNVKIPDLTNYINAVKDYILGNGGNGVEDKFIKDLVSKNDGLLISVSAITNLVNLQLGKGNTITINFNDCNFPLTLELKVDDGNNGGDNNEDNGGNNGNGGYSGGGSHSNSSNNSNSSSRGNNDEVLLSGEVNDNKLEIKKAESCSIEGSTFSEEENQAYLWACEKGIVIADNIMKADMKRDLTRAELAKMMSVYSEELLGRTYVKNESVSYPDVTDKLGDLAYFIQEGYKLQIMGIHADGTALSKFMPNSSVTRGEFATVFSRVLHGDKYNVNGANYYEKHLEVLKNEGILTNTNPKLIEKRGWILLMLYRSQKVEASNGNISNEEIANTTADEEKNGK